MQLIIAKGKNGLDLFVLICRGTSHFSKQDQLGRSDVHWRCGDPAEQPGRGGAHRLPAQTWDLLEGVNFQAIPNAALTHLNLETSAFRVPEGQQELLESKYSRFGSGEGLRVPDHAERSRLPSRRGGAGGGHRTVEHGNSKAEQETSHSCCADTWRTGENSRRRPPFHSN